MLAASSTMSSLLDQATAHKTADSERRRESEGRRFDMLLQLHRRCMPVVRLVLLQLDLVSLVNASQVCWAWRALTDDWVVWRTLCATRGFTLHGPHLDAGGVPNAVAVERMSRRRRGRSKRAATRELDHLPSSTTANSDGDTTVHQEVYLEQLSQFQGHDGFYHDGVFCGWRAVFEHRERLRQAWLSEKYEEWLLQGHMRSIVCSVAIVETRRQHKSSTVKKKYHASASADDDEGQNQSAVPSATKPKSMAVEAEEQEEEDEVYAGRFVATADISGKIVIWDTLSNNQPFVRRINAHLDKVTCLASGLLPNGMSVLVSGGMDGVVRVWDWRGGFAVNSLPPLDFSISAICYIPHLSCPLLGVGDEQGRFYVFEVMGDGEKLFEDRTHTQDITMIEFVPDDHYFEDHDDEQGEQAESAEIEKQSCHVEQQQETEVAGWSAETVYNNDDNEGMLPVDRSTFDGSGNELIPPPVFSSLAENSRTNQEATRISDGSAADAAFFDSHHHVATKVPPSNPDRFLPPVRIGWILVGSLDSPLLMWRYEKQRGTHRFLSFPLDRQVFQQDISRQAPLTGINCVTVMPRHRLMAFGDDEGRISIWSMVDWRCHFLLEGCAGEIVSVFIAQDLSFIAAGSAKGFLVVWQSKEYLPRLVLSFNSDASSHSDATDVSLGQCHAYRSHIHVMPPIRLPGHVGRIRFILAGPDRHMLMTLGDSRCVFVWDLRRLLQSTMPASGEQESGAQTQADSLSNDDENNKQSEESPQRSPANSTNDRIPQSDATAAFSLSTSPTPAPSSVAATASPSSVAATASATELSHSHHQDDEDSDQAEVSHLVHSRRLHRFSSLITSVAPTLDGRVLVGSSDASVHVLGFRATRT